MATSILTRAKAQLVLQEPFYATILLNLKEVLCEVLPDGRPLWLAATNGTELYINPTNVEKLSIGKVKGLLKHEVMHVAQLHNYRGVGKEAKRWNHATDDVINPIIIAEGGELPDGGRPGVPGITAEKRYNELPPEPPQNGNGGGSGQGGKQGRGSAQHPMDDDVMPAKDQSQGGMEKTKVMIAQAAAVAKAMGKMPEKLRQQLEEIFEPKVDWKEQLRQFLTEVTPTDYSFRRPNRRMIAGDNPMYLPGIDGHDSMRGLGVLIDTSGSMSMDDMKRALGEVAGAVADVKPGRLIVAYCDAKVQHSDEFDQPTDAQVRETLERHGGGGTSMPAGLKWFTRKHPDVQTVVVLTDGETPFAQEEDFPFPVLWAITNKRITAPWGTTIHVEFD